MTETDNNDEIMKVLEYFQGYAINISSYLLNFDPDSHEFNCNLDTKHGSLHLIINERSVDGATFEKVFDAWGDMKKNLKVSKKMRKSCIDYLYNKGVSGLQVPKTATKKQFVALFVSNLSIRYAEEAKNINKKLN